MTFEVALEAAAREQYFPAKFRGLSIVQTKFVHGAIWAKANLELVPEVAAMRKVLERAERYIRTDSCADEENENSWQSQQSNLKAIREALSDFDKLSNPQPKQGESE